MSTKRVCVFCGSRPGQSPAYLAAAQEVGRLTAERGLAMVYGGASVGTMGKVADATLAAGGEVIGVIPTSLVQREIAHTGLTQLVEVETLSQRKDQMLELSDGFICLPGGAGTLDELFEVFTWSILGYHQKPCILLNLEGYYDRLLGFLDHVVEQGFLDRASLDLVGIAKTPADALDAVIAGIGPRE